MAERSDLSFLDEAEATCRLAMDPATTGIDLCLILERDALVPVVESIDAAGFFIEEVAVLDVAEGYQARYHFRRFDTPGRIELRVTAPHDDPHIPTIANIFQGAEWHERESMDFYGLTFDGNPNPARLLLPEDATFKPLEKDEKSRKSYLDLIPEFTIVECAEGHPIEELAAKRQAEREEAERKAAEEAKKAEEEARKAAEEEAAKQSEEAGEAG